MKEKSSSLRGAFFAQKFAFAYKQLGYLNKLMISLFFF